MSGSPRGRTPRGRTPRGRTPRGRTPSGTEPRAGPDAPSRPAEVSSV